MSESILSNLRLTIAINWLRPIFHFADGLPTANCSSIRNPQSAIRNRQMFSPYSNGSSPALSVT